MSILSPIQEYRDKPSKVHEHANLIRTCCHEDCKVKLSKYNLTSYCYTHERLYVDFKSVI